MSDFSVMGIVNVTPDSFSDGGLYLDPEAAVRHGVQLVHEGAAILDVGGESTRPGAHSVSLEDELRRVLPVIEELEPLAAQAGVQISIDTSKAAVAQHAIASGATFVNDVTALRGDPAMAGIIASNGVDCCLMHMLGDPRTMQRDPHYEEVVSDVKAFLERQMQFAVAQGISEQRIMLDPGIGFGKTVEHNLELLRRLHELVELGRPVVLGSSRKSFLGVLTGRGVDDRVAGTIATSVIAYEQGARVFRVHDVAPVVDALKVAAATVGSWPTTTPTSSTR